MKRKYYWIQYIPIIGIIWTTSRPKNVWSNRFKPGIIYQGNTVDFVAGVLIQAATFICIGIWLITKIWH